MTVDFRLHLAVLRTELEPYIPYITRVAAQIPAYFAYATRGGSTIRLHLNLDKLNTQRVDPVFGLNAEQLNNCLTDLLPSPQRHTLGVNDIGLLFGDQLATAPGVFGMMFDPGWLGGEEASSIPRQGAAVFVNAIRLARGNALEFERQLLFSCIHEIGHIFNLWHVEDGANLMSSSRPGPNGYRNSAFVFNRIHSHFLSQVSDFPHVHPGGTLFGNRGANYPSESNLNDSPKAKSPLRLWLRIEKRAQWAFEPIEVDVMLKLDAKSRKPMTIVDELDPGYDSFELWIQSPAGNVEKYQPLSRFCHNGTRTLKPGQRFQRDIFITCTNTGFTFRDPGTYLLWAQFRPAGKHVIVSRKVKLVIKPAQPENKDFIAAEHLLTKPNVARILHYKSADPKSSDFKALAKCKKSFKDVGLKASLSYVLGRASKNALQQQYMQKAENLAALKGSARKKLEEAVRHLPPWSHRAKKTRQLLKTDVV